MEFGFETTAFGCRRHQIVDMAPVETIDVPVRKPAGQFITRRSS